MSDSIFSLSSEPVPGSTMLTMRAASECRRLGLYDIPVTPLEFRSVQKWLVRRTQAAVSALGEAAPNKRACECISREYVADIIGFCRNVKLGMVSLGLE